MKSTLESAAVRIRIPRQTRTKKTDIMEKGNTSDKYSPEGEEITESEMVIIYLVTGLTIAALTGFMVYITLFA